MKLKIISAILITGIGLAHSIVHPGYLDVINGAIIGIVLYTLWRVK